MKSGRRQGFWRLRPLASFAAAFCLLAALWLTLGWWAAVPVFLLSGPLWILAERRDLRYFCAGVLAGMCCITLWWALEVRPIEGLRGKGGTYAVTVDDYALGHSAYGEVCGRVEYRGRDYRVRVTLLDGSPHLEPGDRITLEGSLRFTGLTDRFGAPEGRWLELRQAGPMEIGQGSPHTLTQHMAVLRKHWAARISRFLPGEEGALLQALLTGDRSAMSPRTRSILSRSGLSHAAAISGLHLSVLAGIFLALFGKKSGMILAVPILVMFTAFTGFSPSALRALTLWLLIFGAWILKKDADAVTSLLTALLLQVAVNPCALLSVSLQLSFAAVSGLILLGPPARAILPPRSRWSLKKAPRCLLRLALAGVGTTLCATVFTLPLILYYFGTVSLAAPLSNLLALWAVAPAMLLGGLGLVLSGWLPVLGPWLMLPARWLLSWFLLVARWTSGWSFAALPGDLFFTWAAAGTLLLLALTALWKGSLRVWPVGMLATVAAALMICGLYSDAHLQRVTLSCRSGSATLSVMDRDTALCIDPGPYGSGWTAQNLARPFWERGDPGPEVLAATGAHVSRSGALESLCALTQPQCVLAPQSVLDRLESRPEGALVLSDYSRYNGMELLLLPSGREDRPAWRLILPELTVLSVCGAQPRVFLVDNGSADLSCDLLILDEAFLGAPGSLELLLRRTSPGAVAVTGTRYTPIRSLEGVWEGPVYDLRGREEKTFKIFRK